jgi:uncharacterized lipoprotein YehR (DUF1307 family)
MKKLFVLLMAFILTLALVGCGKQEPRRSDEGWALHYAIEYHEERVERLPKEYAFRVEEYVLNGVDDSCVKLSCTVLFFEVTLLTGFDTYNYYVMIEVIDTITIAYKEVRIIQYDVD